MNARVLLAIVVATTGTVLLVELGGTESTPGAPAAGAPPRFGFNDNAVAQGRLRARQDAVRLAAVGARVARVQFDWDRAEPEKGVYDLGRYDRLDEAYRRHGVRMLLIFAFAPPWAATQPCSVPGCHVAPSAEHVSDAARTVVMLSRRYPDLAGIEIWNEPNTPYFWGGPPDPAAYTRLLATCAHALRRRHLRTPVVGGAIANSTGANGTMALDEFLDGMLRAGAAGVMDALSIHPYPSPGDTLGLSVQRTVAGARDVLRARGSGSMPIWATEVGMSTTGPGAVSDADQKTALLAAIRQLRAFAQVRMILVHTLVDPNRGPDSPESGFGVLRSDLSAKPAACALASAAGSAGHCAGRGA